MLGAPGVRPASLIGCDATVPDQSADGATECLPPFQQSSRMRLYFWYADFLATEVLDLVADQSFCSVVVDGNLVDRVHEFTYLGRLQSSDGYCRTQN